MKKYIFHVIVFLIVYTNGIYSQIIDGSDYVEQGINSTYTKLSGPSGTYWQSSGDFTIISQSETTLEIEWNIEGVFKVELWIDNNGIADLIAEKEIIVGSPPKLEFAYDAAGNRFYRNIIILGSATKSLTKNNNSLDFKIKNELELKKIIEEDIEEDRQFKVYPNPTQESIYITLNEEACETADRHILVFDNTGRKIIEKQALDDINQLDLSDLKTGLYFVVLVYGEKSKQCKIIKK